MRRTMGRKPNQGGLPPDREADETADRVVASTARPAAVPKPKPGDARRARLAAALRANLRRRKSQARGRDATDPASPDSFKPDDEREP